MATKKKETDTVAATEKKKTTTKKATKKTEEKKPEKDTPAKEETANTDDNERIILYSKPEKKIADALVGTSSDELMITKEKSAAEISNDLYTTLKRYEHDGEVLWGTVVGVEKEAKDVVVIVVWNGIMVKISASSYFEPEFDFGKNFSRMRFNEDKLARIARCAKYQLNATVCFKVATVRKRLLKTGPFAGTYEIICIGNRRLAMETIRDIYFWHKNRKLSESQAPRSIKIGDIVTNVNVLSVKEDNVLVECKGVETRLGAHNLLDSCVVDNCCDYVKPGDTITVRIKQIYLNEENGESNSVHLSVTGRLNEPKKNLSMIQIGADYLAIVDGFNKEKGVYTVIIKGYGVPASVPEANVLGRIGLIRGDMVLVHVTNKYDGFVAGSARKM